MKAITAVLLAAAAVPDEPGSPAALRNRLVLERAMERFGFTNYWREWWHFEHRPMGARYLDLTLGC